MKGRIFEKEDTDDMIEAMIQERIDKTLAAEREKVEALAARCAQLTRERDLARGEVTIAQGAIIQLQAECNKLHHVLERRS